MKKRILSGLLLLCLAFGFVGAQDSELEVGMEYSQFFIWRYLSEGGTINPSLKYENSFGDFDIMAKGSLLLPTDGDVFYFSLEGEVAYNLLVGPGKLVFLLNSENSVPVISEMFENLIGYFRPSVKYSQDLSFGTLFGKVGLNMLYFSTDSFMNSSYIYGTLGYGNQGFGAEVTYNYLVDPDAFFTGINFLFDYENEQFYAGVTLNTKFDFHGFSVDTNSDFDSFSISPEVKLYISNFTIWASVDVLNVGSKYGAVVFYPTLGVSCKF